MLRSPRSARPAAALAAMAAAALLLPTAASASVEVHSDARNDVVKVFPAARGSQEVDILRLRTDYQSSTLQLRMKVVSLASSNWSMLWRVQAGDREFGVGYGPSAETWFVQTGGPEAETECSGSDVGVTTFKNTVTLVVPTDCVGATPTVRTGALIGQATRRGAVRGDDGRRDGEFSLDPSQAALGPEVPID